MNFISHTEPQGTNRPGPLLSGFVANDTAVTTRLLRLVRRVVFGRRPQSCVNWPVDPGYSSWGSE